MRLSDSYEIKYCKPKDSNSYIKQTHLQLISLPPTHANGIQSGLNSNSQQLTVNSNLQ